MTHYLIIGQGLAGTILAYTLIKKGKKVIVIDAERGEVCSQIAAGLLNPITGKRQIKTWLADTIFPFLVPFYQGMEKDLGAKILYQMPVYHPFESIEQQNAWIAQSAEPEWRNYMETQVDTQKYQNILHQYQLGGWQGKMTGYVDIPTMIDKMRKWLLQQNCLIETQVFYEDIHIDSKQVAWKNIQAEALIFCEGMKAQQNPFFPNLPFNFVKGEVLQIKTTQTTDLQEIINQGVFVVPLPNQTLRVGSTYKWKNLNTQTTPEAQEELTSKLNKFFKPTYQVIHQKAGIRPATKDRRPLIGLHKNYKNVGIFNGLGSKGASLAPFFAEQFANFLMQTPETPIQLPPEVDVYRFE